MKNMKILLESVHQTFLHRASGKDIKFEIDLPEQEDLTAYIDEAMIKQVFNNLVSNALKFTERGGTVSLTAARSASNIVIRVKDTGRGIPLGAREHLFQPLFQVKGDDIKAGLGFGLTIVKQYVDRHRGEIKVESEQGQGSEFIVTLPKTWAPAKPAES
jgi:signal transduction histidine kinase